jgi:hypothetical protein
MAGGGGVLRVGQVERCREGVEREQKGAERA